MKTKAAVLHEMERPRPYRDSKPLTVEEVHLDPPGEGEVLVQMAGAGLCHSDLSTIDGSRPRPMPMVLGHEASGVVLEVGKGVNDFKVGDPVVFTYAPTCGTCRCCAAGRTALCEKGAVSNTAGTLLGGGVRIRKRDGAPVLHHLGVSGFAQYSVAAQESLVKIESSVSLPMAALFGCAVLTGVGAIVNTAKVATDETVAVYGLGGVGLSAIMGAKLAGASKIIAVDMRPEKFELAKKLGATDCIDASKTDSVAAIRDLTQGGVDHAVEAVGNAKVLAQAYESACRGGGAVSIGLPHPNQQLTIQAVSIVAQEKSIRGSYMGSATPRRDIPRYIRWYQEGKLPVDALLSGSIRLEQINEGFDALAEGKAIRQVIDFG